MSTAVPFPIDARLQKPICIFCGSSPGSSPIYALAAESVGAALAEAGIPLVYGGGRRGIMGAVSQATLKNGGYAHGVVRRALIQRASEHTRIPTSASGQAIKSGEGSGTDILDDDYDGRLTMEVTGSMHESKLKMAQVATGGFVVLPGGYGTFEEVLEMITWNQLGIHRLPISILNIGNLFTPMRALFENAVEAGFISPENLSLLRIVDLDGGATANADEARAGEWGQAALLALQQWSIADRAGYGIKWDKEETKDETFSLFTTLRYTSPDPHHPTLPIERSHIPLLDRHIMRLKEAHGHFSARDESSVWGVWPGDEGIWNVLKEELEVVEKRERGDWRVRLLIHRGAQFEVQIVPAPAGAGPFQLLPLTDRPSIRRPMVLDSKSYDHNLDKPHERDLRLYKTSQRDMYDAASSRGSHLMPNVDHLEVLIHSHTYLLETITSNIALYLPTSEPNTPGWITPRLDKEPFLNGVMRHYLLDEGVIRQGRVTADDWDKVKREGGRVIGFNGLRGVWEAEPL